ncbi:MAG: putative membrane-bound dehydrogenase-like protein [Glaciecola sp.]|jgi:putative membrane-bound dehydrogenase-like protein
MLSLLAPLVLSMLPMPQAAGERLDVLFIGDRGHHQPEARLHDVFGPLLRSGFAVDWEDDLSHITPELLADYDCVLMYANQAQHAVVPPVFFSGLQNYVREGGGFVALHCTSGCFMQSQEWLEFVGARFVSHGAEIFQQEIIAEEHAIMDGWANFAAWDETYVQTHHNEGRTVLTTRGNEPWSWVRSEGKGRVFYSASGHDERVWKEPAFLEMLVRAMDWTAGTDAANQRKALTEPVFLHKKDKWVPNYEGRDPHPNFQLPSTPEQARQALIVPAGFRAEIFASEPMIVNPIAMAWDERGRCWVAESPDYPNTLDAGHSGRDRISILEDTNGDGRADKKTVFKDGLNLPTSILKVKGGVLVTQAPDLLFLRDDNNDDQCDGVVVALSGFGRWDTHAGPSNLRWGPDNAIWGAVGYSSYDSPTLDQFGSGLWRWDLKGDDPEFIAQFTNNTWGLAFRGDGELFGSTANGAPSFYVGAPKNLTGRTSPNAPGAAPVANTAFFHPALEHLHQGDYFGKFTAAAGHSFATGAQVPAGWIDRSAFVCGPTGHLVGRLDSYAEGSGWRTRDAFNLCSSIDDWFCPVQADVGPDGAVWIADFAQFIILHNLPGNPERGLPKIDFGDGNAHLNPLRDNEHGRIFRIARKGNAGPSPRLDLATDEQLLKALEHPNNFWQVTAQRLLVEGGRESAIPGLLQLPTASAVRALAGLGALTTDASRTYLQAALRSPDVAWCKSAMRALPASAESASLLVKSGLLESASPDLRRSAFLCASRMPESAAIGVALAGRALMENIEDVWLSQTLTAAIASHAAPFLAAAVPMLFEQVDGKPVNLFPNLSFETAANDNPKQPLAWRVRSYSGDAQHTWEAGAGKSGGRALVIRSSTGADTSWCTDIAVDPGTRYRLSGWIQTQGVTHEGGTHGALLNIHPLHVVTNYVQDDSDWTRVELEFQTKSGERQVSINCLFGGWGQSTGVAIFDDLELVSLGPAQDLRALVELARKFGQDPDMAEVTSDLGTLLRDGDYASGENTFFNNEVISCVRCHAWGGQGGGVGPDLMGVGQRLSREKILESILDPNAVLSESWPAAASAMPALRPFLTDKELRDLVHFLATHKE